MDKSYLERFLTALRGITGDEETAADYLRAVYFGSNLAHNMSVIGMIPVAKDLRSMGQGFTVERMDASTVSDVIQAAQKLMSGRLSTGYGAYRLCAVAAKILGVSAVNLERDAVGLTRTLVYGLGGPRAAFDLERLIYNPGSTSNKSRYYGILYRALEEGSVEDYIALRERLDEALGESVSSKDIEEAMLSRYKKAVKGNGAYTLPEKSAQLLGVYKKYAGEKEPEEKFTAENLSGASYTRYANQRAQWYKAYRDGLERTSEFRALSNEDKDRAMGWAESLAKDRALEANSDGQFQIETKWERQAAEAEAYGISVNEYLLWHVIYQTTTGTKDEDGKDIRGEAKKDKVRDWLERRPELTDGQRAWLWGTEYASEW